MVGEHLNVRLALCLRVHSHRQPSAQKWLLQGHCCRCYSVHCPSLSSCCGNGPFWANCLSVAASRPMAVVLLLGTTELCGRLFRALTWNTANCLFFFFLTRSSEIISPAQIPPMLLTLGHQKNSGLDHSLEQQSPELNYTPQQAPCNRGTAHMCTLLGPVRRD